MSPDEHPIATLIRTSGGAGWRLCCCPPCMQFRNGLSPEHFLRTVVRAFFGRSAEDKLPEPPPPAELPPNVVPIRRR